MKVKFEELIPLIHCTLQDSILSAYESRNWMYSILTLGHFECSHQEVALVITLIGGSQEMTYFCGTIGFLVRYILGLKPENQTWGMGRGSFIIHSQCHCIILQEGLWAHLDEHVYSCSLWAWPPFILWLILLINLTFTSSNSCCTYLPVVLRTSCPLKCWADL